MNSKGIRIWDLPTRLFHWLLAFGVAGALISGQLGGSLIDWHGRIGLLIVGLLAFRLVWGVLGSTYARFAQFFPTPARIRAYLRGEWREEGHNPLGALSVLALLGLLIAQVSSGLFSNDDIAFAGPLADLISRELSNRLTGVHHLLANLLMALIALHVGAIVFYSRVRRQELFRPMLTGWKAGDGKSARGGGLPALLLALVVAVAAVYGASGAWLPAASPPTVEAPSW